MRLTTITCITENCNKSSEIVSDHSHPRYGQHLSAQEVNELIQPTKETTAAIEEWLSDHGVESYNYNSAKDWVSVLLPVSAACRLLDTEYHVFEHLDDKEVLIRAPEWSLPRHLHDHVVTIQPTNSFFRPRSEQSLTDPYELPQLAEKRDNIPTYDELAAADKVSLGHIEIPDIKDLPSNPTPAQACNKMVISPLCLRVLYGTFGYVPQVPEKQQIGLVNYLGQVSNRSDIQIYLERYRPDAAKANVSYTFQTEIVAEGDDQQTPNTNKGREGNLDAEVVLGIGFPIPLVTYNVGGMPLFKNSKFTTKNTNEPYLTWLQYVLSKPSLPQVITTSYADEEQTVPYAYAKRVCEGFAQLGARGISVLFGSGDEGVGHDGLCTKNDRTGDTAFLPSFPASCPYVTAVGSTRYIDPELVAFDARTSFVSGGGFSNYFPRPRYQSQVVDNYISNLGDQHRGLYNRHGRGFPDISAQGYHYPVIWNGTAHLDDGTSASSPAVAAIISLVNDNLIANGRPPLGFLNPFIYSTGFEAFSDVTIGSASGCNTTGFPAMKGWDAATGFGTPVS